MVLLAGVVTYWKKYFGDNKLRKRSRTGCSDELRLSRPQDTLLESIGNEVRTKTEIIEPSIESHNVFKIGSKKYPLHRGYELNTSAVKINAQDDASSASLVTMIEDLNRTMNEKIGDLGRTMNENNADLGRKINEKIADLDTKIIKIQNDVKKMGGQKIRNEPRIELSQIRNSFV